jgi:hypothetical protein
LNGLLLGTPLNFRGAFFAFGKKDLGGSLSCISRLSWLKKSLMNGPASFMMTGRLFFHPQKEGRNGQGNAT